MANKNVDIKINAIDNASNQIDRISKSMGGMNKSASGTGKGLGTMSLGIKNIAKGVGVFKAIDMGMKAITSSVGTAVSRFDTMNKFPKMMRSLGYSTQDVDKSMKMLSDGIDGLPTKLDDVVSTTQRLALMTGDLDGATKATLALNNAFLASGSSGADASRGLQQYTQMLATGKVDMQSWKTLQETMPLALQKTAEAFGYTGKSAQNDFYSALQSGEITFDQFQDKLIELNDGVGGFADLAKQNSLGIATSFENLGNAVGKGMANVLKAIDDLVLKLTGSNIAEIIDSMKSGINMAFDGIVKGIEIATPYIETAINMFKNLGDSVGGDSGLLNAFMSVADGITGIVVPLLSDAFNFIKDILYDLVIFWKENGKQIMDAVNNTFNFISNVISVQMNVMKSVISTMWNAIKIIIQTVLGVIKGIVQVWSGAMTGDFTQLWNGIKTITSSIWNGIKGLLSNLWNGIKSIASSAFNGMKSVIVGIWNTIKGMASSIWSGIQSAIMSPVNSAVSAVTGAFQGLLGTVTGIWNSIVSIFGKAKSLASQAGSMLSKLNPFRSMPLPQGETATYGVEMQTFGTFDNVINEFSSMASSALGKGLNVARSTELNFGDMQMVNTAQPAEINLSLGKRDYKVFVEDISAEQSRSFRLESTY